MVRCKVSRNMDACPRYLCTCVYVIVCMSARKKAPVNLLMCPFELYSSLVCPCSFVQIWFFSSDPILLVGCPWKKKKKKKISRQCWFRSGSYSVFVSQGSCVSGWTPPPPPPPPPSSSSSVASVIHSPQLVDNSFWGAFLARQDKLASTSWLKATLYSVTLPSFLWPAKGEHAYMHNWASPEANEALEGSH